MSQLKQEFYAGVERREPEKKEIHRLNQVAIRMVEMPPLFSEEPMNGPAAAVKVMADTFRDYDREVNRFRRSFHGQRRLLVQQLHKGLLLRAQGPPVRIDQNILHALALGRALPEHQTKALAAAVSASSASVFFTRPTG